MDITFNRPRKTLRPHLAQHIKTDVVHAATPHFVENEPPILWWDGVPGFHGPDVALFNGKQSREGRDPNFVDDVLERHYLSLHQVAMRVKTACSDSDATLCGMARALTREEVKRRKEQGARLRKARESVGYRSARSAAIDNDWPESTYRSHEGGTRTIGQDDAETYAKRFRLRGGSINACDILFGDERAANSALQPLRMDERGTPLRGTPNTREPLERLLVWFGEFVLERIRDRYAAVDGATADAIHLLAEELLTEFSGRQGVERRLSTMESARSHTQSEGHKARKARELGKAGDQA